MIFFSVAISVVWNSLLTEIKLACFLLASQKILKTELLYFVGPFLKFLLNTLLFSFCPLYFSSVIFVSCFLNIFDVRLYVVVIIMGIEIVFS